MPTIKYHIFGRPRLLLRGRTGARIEIGLAVVAYNPKGEATARLSDLNDSLTHDRLGLNRFVDICDRRLSRKPGHP